MPLVSPKHLFTLLLLSAALQANAAEASDSLPAKEIQAKAEDDVVVFGDYYRSTEPASGTVLLFHQAGGDARGEYAAIAQRLTRYGYDVYAWDARSGGDHFGSENRTVTALGESIEGYCGAYPDLEEALQYAIAQNAKKPVIAIGSSYSAALVIRLAAEHSDHLAGVVAFSPASGLMEDCDVTDWLARSPGVNKLVFRPANEMEFPPVAEQVEFLQSHDVEVFVAPDAPHGASMLNAERSEGDVTSTWNRLLEFFKSVD